MAAPHPLLIARGESDQFLLPPMANRHGLVAGATGTGKTVTIHAMATQFSEIGVPVFLADVKGDLAGISQPGGNNEKVTERVQSLGLTDFAYTGFPVAFWDVFGELGHPVRATISEMGPLLLSRLLNLNDTQNGVLTLVFKYADDRGLLLLDLKDLRAILQFVGDNRKGLTTEYGTVAPASIGAIQRGLLRLEEGGGDLLFGEPALELTDLMRTTADGQGVINILAADRLMRSPTVYATFLLWLLSELFEQMPEAGDLAKPKLVFFFDEAHLLFTDAPEALQDKIEQVIRLIRSKGIGVFFVSQNPIDVPDVVLGQLGNRVQHALRAYTPRDQKAVRAAAETFRGNPKIDVEQAISQLEVGEALTSFLDPNGAPGIVERAYVIPPRSLIGTITTAQRAAIVAASPVRGKYEQTVDRISAYEMLKQKATETVVAAERAAEAEASWEDAAQREERKPRTSSRRRNDSPEAMLQDVAESAARSFGSQIGRGLVRGLLGSLTGRRR